ncbi:CARDB domain-containing protein [Natrarchaeobius oligotrophus]|uniref:CARDB domain-containing protein n=1 Tax=Natrarchaeobius chitinivorans TaxID=1679083 RepID=A0A3N6PD11_NATCH|nr:CARDB domain-containing protein [Natrarchaeobius chitinivorans]RQG97479.1 hypothetical protein EA472_19150 [Natrarchaeobius chitinivorans]
MNTRLLVGIAALALVLAVPTAAVSVQSDTAGPIALESTSPYASVDGGELSLDFDRLNDRAVTETDEVFAITATDETIESVWIETDVDGLAFYGDGDPNAKVNGSNPLALDAGDVAAVGVSIDTRDATDGSETFTVHVTYEDDEQDDDDHDSSPSDDETNESVRKGDGDVPEGSIEQRSLELSSSTIQLDEPVAVTATYENAGNATESHVVGLAIDDVVVDSRSVTLAPNESETVAFEWYADEPGSYGVSVDGASAGTVTVEEPPSHVVVNRELAASTTAALAPPAAVGLLFVFSVARRRI